MATHHLDTRPTVNHNIPYDSALADHLAALKETCRQIGATEMRVLRDAEMAWLYYETISQNPGNPDTRSPSKSRTIGELRLPRSGVIFLARFTATDGGEPGVE